MLVLIGVAAIVANVLSMVLGLVGLAAPGGPLPGVLFVILLLAVIGLARGFRRLSEPLDRLVEAARRVEDGSYEVRVPESRHGPRELRELSRAFNTMASRLENNQRQRQALLADVGHELRTPLAVIRGNLEAIVDGVHPADEAHLAGLIDETRVMERLVEDLRTLSLAEAGSLPLYREPTDPDVLLGEVVAAHQAEATRAGVTLELETDRDLPILDVDPVRIREVLANLIGNAFRATSSGDRITISGSVEAATMSAIVFQVQDTGAGIDPEILPHVFDRFAKGRDSRGSGLGLAIARDLVNAHGGSIEVSSQPGEGTTFVIRLPVAPPT
ncbi:MAG: ATP-binding protein [Chloroflexota bacterium]